ncbi:MAG: hypothetical protein ACRDRD_07810 [Pseudonocardiaceae bacterium]
MAAGADDGVARHHFGDQRGVSPIRPAKVAMRWERLFHGWRYAKLAAPTSTHTAAPPLARLAHHPLATHHPARPVTPPTRTWSGHPDQGEAGDHMRRHPHHQHHRSTPKTPGTVSPLRRSQRPRQATGAWRIERVEFVLMTTAEHRAATQALSALLVEWITHTTPGNNQNNDHTQAA